jgi:Flp pilus assembly protein TadG
MRKPDDFELAMEASITGCSERTFPMLFRTRSRLGDSPRGVAAVEFALMLPLLAFILVAVVDFGRVFYFSSTIANCARNGAVYASDPISAAESPYTSIQQAALADASDLKPAPTVTSASGSDTSGNPYVAVTVNYTFKSITSFPGIPNNSAISRTVRVRVAPTTPG